MNKDRLSIQAQPNNAKLISLALTNSLRTQRALFLTQLKSALQQLQRSQQSFVLLLIKIENIADVEQNFGSDLSNNLISIIRHHLQSLTSSKDCLVNLQGDEFALLKTDITDAESAIDLAKEIQSQFRFSFQVNNYKILCNSSIGISLQQAPHSVSQVLKDADIALKHAQQRGLGQYHLSTALPVPVKNTQAILQQEQLTHAIINHDILPYYQPIIQLNSNQLVGFEVIAHWHEQEQNDDNNFISLAENTDIIIALDLHIIYQACVQLKKWHDSHSDNQQIMLTMNLSAKHLILDGAVEHLIFIIQQQQIPPHRLVFEFREHECLARNKFAMRALEKLRQIGVQVGLDDFGTGFSSLNAFFQYPIDFVKIDSRFTNRMLMSKKDLSLIRVIRDMSHDMGFKVIVEGIDSPQQHAKLIELGCEFGQGSYIAQPMDYRQVNRLLEL
ncbi:MAG: bifunctional diguanylate cyclase/phosphodiesterase [Moritella sp.]|uniref:bifunctional diguanylate cyclase/phosphodiesterase n=1 Tax=Moritella sp. TaxID=78556 RepID=UPI0029BD2170|nr:bifunctional diguanylate cyclase/phosphodiesterase [Moritella sp.]MDX2319078.1 bifunctional diguanylate cyclase/phosphodiesterase [Moritella sp.]